MAFKRKTKRITRKKRPMKKRTNKKRNTNTVHAISRSLGAGLPDQIVMTHKYAEQSYFNAATGGYQYYTFSCNDMYDPNVTGVGHQPYYFDQLSQLYQHYTVIGSKIKVTFIPVDNDAAGGGVPANVGVYINDNSTITPSANYATLQELCVRKRRGQSKWMSGGQSNNTVLRTNWSAKKSFGGSVMANNALRGAAGASPTEQQYFSIWFYNAHSSATAETLFNVEIEYIAVWTELKDIAGS